MSSGMIPRAVTSVQHLPLKTIPVCWSSSIILNNSRCVTFTNSRTYAAVAPKKSATATKPSGSAAGGRMKEFPVETDTRKLQEYCCGLNILKEGEEVKLKPESEYPDWLFTLRCGPPKPLEELEPNSKEYWERVRKLAMKQNNLNHRFRMKVMKKF